MNFPEQLLEIIDRRIANKVRPPAGFAQVTTTAPLTVTFPGDTAAVPVTAAAGYTPTLGATVILLKVGIRDVAIGELA